VKWANDKWTSKETTFAQSGPLAYDKVQHFLGGLLLGLLFRFMFHDPYFIRDVALVAFLWELKDGWVDWRDGYVTEWPIRYNWGGDGFSWKDLLASIAGVIVSAI